MIAELDEHLVYSGDNNGMILLWSAVDESLRCTLEGHTAKITCLHAKGKRLYSGSADLTIKVWECQDDTNACLATLEDHTCVIEGLALFKNRLYSHGIDNIVKVWSIEDFSSIDTLDGNTNRVREMAIRKDERVYVMSDYNNTDKNRRVVHAWDRVGTIDVPTYSP